ncbi:methionyl-tRNA formyltransferase [Streptomyces parvus]|uniref:methionyl-tRNA formyltransferase n=1 Tax=Streptomyces parvus TaxID=66428 RepID=UPI0036BC7C09
MGLITVTRVIRVVLFSEVNSKLGSPFLRLLQEHPQVELAAFVTSPPGKLCSYFVDDPQQVDVAAQAEKLNVRVFRPEKVNSPQSLAYLRQLHADYFIVGNFQQIMKKELLEIPAVTSVNFHPSPLPRYAGLAPFYWMVRNGEQFGAVSAIEMTPGIDAGPLLMQKPMYLTGQETALKLRTAQEHLNVKMLSELIPQLADQSFVRTPQDESIRSYFGRPTDNDYRIDFTQNSETVCRVVRAGYRHPGAFTIGADGERLVVLSVGMAGRVCRAPLERPGTVRNSGTGLFVAASDEWLRLVSVERNGQEVLVVDDDPSLTHGVVLGEPKSMFAIA